MPKLKTYPTHIIDGILYIAAPSIEGHKYIDGICYIPRLSPLATPIEDQEKEVLDKLVSNMERLNSSIPINSIRDFLGRLVPQDRISSLIELAVGGGCIRRVDGTDEYIVNKGN